LWEVRFSFVTFQPSRPDQKSVVSLSFAIKTRSALLDGRRGFSDKLETTSPRQRPTGCQRCRAGRARRGTEDGQKEEKNEQGGERGRLAGAELRRASDVAVMQAPDFGNRDDGAALRRLDRPSVGCILVEREVRTGPMIVREVRGQDAS
jgi:hypothetical protein